MATKKLKPGRPALRVIGGNPRRSTDTIFALECLLRNAINGDVTGLALCYRTRSGEDKVLVTDVFAADHTRAAGAGMLIASALTQAQDDGE